ncbi:universal stress protein [Halopiger djelfimassiliensis]|uniref:universal stress protein n=1 Tax=Halopiger djelfimassiliensis TaxID=1293047 RepID=UPI000677FCEF|nr:universal stress protein [Halopiger djelfimassiliensis]
MYREILVPTDGNERMGRVIEEAIELADRYGATVHALHAIDERAYTSIPPDARGPVRERLREDGEAATRSVAERAIESDVAVTRELRTGPPAHVIVSYAVENGIDLIVMGTHGRTGYERYLLGSVAERVVRSAPTSVLTVSLDDRTDAVEVVADGSSVGIDPERAGDGNG